MKTTDLFKINRKAKRMNESLEKTFGQKLNLENFDLHQLQDARNKIRTQLSQIKSDSGFNENLENEAYHKAQFMLDTLNAEIIEREEFVAEVTDEEVDEYFQFDTPKSKDRGPRDDGHDELARREKVMGKGGLAKDARDYKEKDKYGDAYKIKGPKGKLPENQDKNESIETGEDMTRLQEGEIQQASAIVTAKTMVDRVGRWIEELSGMENDTLLQLGDSIRDEMSQELAKQFISTCAPAIQAALENLKQTRETLATGVRTLTGEEQGAEMLGAEPAAAPGEEELGAAAPDTMNAGGEMGGEDLGDEFGAADAAAGGAEEAGRLQRESIQYQNRLLKVLAG